MRREVRPDCYKMLLFFSILAVWVNREQQKRLEFYQEQLKVMMKAQGRPR